ncbi:MAG: OmpH family outer membrane protein [Phycisphaerae bacterium]
MSLFSLLMTAALMPVGQSTATDSVRVAVVDLPAVSEAYKKTSDLEAKFEAIRQKLNQQRDALRDRVDLTKRSLQEELKPGTDAYRERRKQLALLEAELQFFMESESQRVEGDLARSLGHIFADIQETIRTVAKEKGIDLVVSADRMPDEPAESPTQVRQQILLQKVLYWSPQVDLTGEITARLNAKYKAEGGNASIE